MSATDGTGLMSHDLPPDGTTTITGIDAMARDPNVRVVRVDGRIVARLTASTVESLELAAGQPWTTERAEAVEHALAMDRARRDALRLLGRAAIPSPRLVERLERREHASHVARAVAEELIEEGWLDDRAVAESVASAVLRKGPASPAMLTHRLRARGVPAPLAEEVAEAMRVDSLEDAVALVEDLLRRQRDDEGRPRRIAATLARRGFEDGTIREAMRTAGLDVPDA